MRRFRSVLTAVVVSTLTAVSVSAPVSAQTMTATAATPIQPAAAFTARAKELLGILAGTGDYTAFFTPGFQTAVPKDKFAPVNVQLNGAYGAPAALDGMTMQTSYTGHVNVRYAKATIAFSMVVDPAEPHQVSGLRVLGPVAAEKSLADVTKAIDALPGITAYAFARLGAAAPALTIQHNVDQRLAVGSAFKLVILAELVRATNAGERTWDDLITLDGRLLPGGGYAARPAGTKVSLRELATQMISISDNSATDILLAAAGREKVEAMLPVLGVSPDSRNIPYLSTLEMFKLKWLENGKLGERYTTLDVAGKRAMLAGDVLTADITPLMSMGAAPRLPSFIDRIEWFFSPADLIRVMDWLRRNTEGAKGTDARAVLSKNPGIQVEKAQYAWTGFKGGSEPGVMNLSFLLQGTDGNWYAASATWNDQAKPVTEGRFAELMAALLKFAGPQR